MKLGEKRLPVLGAERIFSCSITNDRKTSSGLVSKLSKNCRRSFESFGTDFSESDLMNARMFDSSVTEAVFELVFKRCCTLEFLYP